MGNYLDLFPRVAYDISGTTRYRNYNVMANLLFRFGFLKNVLNNISAYSLYTIRDGDTPEILAEKIYNDPEAHWIILLANDIVDPQFDWPLDDVVFRKYLTNKYGSIANAKTTIHHYEKVITREEVQSGIITETRYVVDYETLTNSIITLSSYGSNNFVVGQTVWVGNSVSDYTFSGNVQAWSNSNGYLSMANTNGSFQLYSTLVSNTANGLISDIVLPAAPYDTYRSLPETQGLETVDFGNNKTVIETIRRDAISNYDWEITQNEKKREIKIIKPVYYRQIIEEFDKLTKNSRNPFIRTLR